MELGSSISAAYGYDVRAELVGEAGSIAMNNVADTRRDVKRASSTRYDTDGADVITTPMCAKTVISCGLWKQGYFQILHRIAGMDIAQPWSLRPEPKHWQQARSSLS